MIKDLLSNLNAKEIQRINVDFKIDKVSLSSLIGRTSHI